MGKTILMCCNAYPPDFIGGAELIAHQQAKVLQRHGHTVIAFVGSRLPIGDPYSMREESYEGLRVFRIRLQSSDYQPENVSFFHPRVEEHFAKLIDLLSPDVVHMHNLIGLSAGLVSTARARGIKTVLTVHDYWLFCYKNTRIFADGSICGDFTRCAHCMPYIDDGRSRAIPIRMRNDFLMTQASRIDCVLSPSQHIADAYIQAGVPASRVRVLWYGVDVARFSRVQKIPGAGRLRVTYIGVLGLHKGVHLIPDALRILERQGKDVEVNLAGAGEGDLKEVLQHCVAELNLRSSVNFIGKVDNSRIEELLSRTDVLLLPSLWPENQPVSILEAMASRTAVIASRIGGIPELVRHGSTGYLFDPGDANGLAVAISLFLDNPEQVRRFGDAGYEAIRGASLESQVLKLIEIYDERVSTAPERKLIACAGERVNAICGTIVHRISPGACRIVMCDWLDDETLAHAAIFWVVDADCKKRELQRGMSLGVPILVPESNLELRQICVEAKCGLYYASCDDAEAAISYLLEQEGARRKMGENARRFARGL